MHRGRGREGTAEVKRTDHRPERRTKGREMKDFRELRYDDMTDNRGR